MAPRYLLVGLLVALPLAITGWVAWRGRQAPTWELSAADIARAADAGAAGDRAVPSADAALQALLEPPPAGTTARGTALYDAKTLFDYIDGAAPLYLERSFRRLAAVELATASGSELTCDVYDMSTPEAARSIFDAERSSQARPVEGWEAAHQGPMSFVFQAGRYYVKLTAFDGTAEAALPGLAASLRERVR